MRMIQVASIFVLVLSASSANSLELYKSQAECYEHVADLSRWSSDGKLSKEIVEKHHARAVRMFRLCSNNKLTEAKAEHETILKEEGVAKEHMKKHGKL